MRIRSRSLVALIAIAALVGCTYGTPDPRHPTLERMQVTSYGAYAQVELTTGASVEGELIAADGTVIRLLPLGSRNVITIAKPDIASGRLFRYESEAGVGAWGTVGTLSTLSHGFFLIFTAPIWMLWTGLTARSEDDHVVLEFHRGGWDEVAKWARFPQGMPPGFGQSAPGASAPGNR